MSSSSCASGFALVSGQCVACPAGSYSIGLASLLCALVPPGQLSSQRAFVLCVCGLDLPLCVFGGRDGGVLSVLTHSHSLCSSLSIPLSVCVCRLLCCQLCLELVLALCFGQTQWRGSVWSRWRSLCGGQVLRLGLLCGRSSW